MASSPTITQPMLRAPFNAYAPDELLKHFQQRRSVRAFPVLDETQISRALTDEVLRDGFTFNEETHHLPAGFDWLANPSADEEWHILLHKFYYVTGLGHAFETTRDERYARKWVELTDSWIARTPLDFLPTDVTGRRLQNWVSAHEYFVTRHHAASIAPAFYVRFLHSLHQQTAHLRANLTPARNHRTLELWALFFVAVTFPEFGEAAEWLAFTIQELTINAQSDLLADGVHCELSTDYHHLALRNFLYVARLAQLNDITLPAAFHAQVRKALDFALYAHKPDGEIPSLSDGDRACYLPLLAQGYELYGNSEWLYAATRGEQGCAPAQRSRGFAASGYYVLRSGWGATKRYEDERYLIFDCGPLGAGNHGHFDLLNFEMAAFGRSLIVDPGRYTYHEPAKADATETNWRTLFRGTAAHNTVTVNGLNQTRYEFVKRKFRIKGAPPEHDLAAFVTKPDFDYLHGLARSHEYAATHERKIAFVCPEYFLVVDRLTAETPHDYALRFHLSAEAHEQTRMNIERATLLIDAPHLVIAQPADERITPTIESGWVSPRYGVKHEAPVINFARRARDACFYSILFPYQDERPDIVIERLPVSIGARECNEREAVMLCVTLTRDGVTHKDYFLLAHESADELHSCGVISFRGRLLHLRTNGHSKLLQRHLTV